MPNRFLRPLGGLVAIAVAALLVPATASADDVVANLRVLTPNTTLEPGASYVTDSESLKTDPKALCFIGGAGGSGDRVRMEGPTALGIVRSALDWNQALDPISVTDEFGFGLGVCGIGGKKGNSERFWSLALNHVDPAMSGDQVQLSDGDEVLWYLTTFPVPPELEITEWPAGVNSAGNIPVSVVEHSCTTDSEPPFEVHCTTETDVDGATITGGDSPVTTTDGQASVPVSDGKVALQATLGSDIPSNIAKVCVSEQEGACPGADDPHGATIYGRDKADRFSGTPGWDRIKAGGGDDRIDLTDGGVDHVNCGGGHDRVRVDVPGDDHISRNCERVIDEA
jgi:hypothetical protein